MNFEHYKGENVRVTLHKDSDRSALVEFGEEWRLIGVNDYLRTLTFVSVRHNVGWTPKQEDIEKLNLLGKEA